MMTSTDALLPKDLPFPMPSMALVPAAWYLGAHMLLCIQEASTKELKFADKCKTQRQAQLKTANKSTQTVSSYLKNKPTGRKTPSNKGHKRQDSKSEMGEEMKVSARGRRKSISDQPAFASPSKKAIEKPKVANETIPVAKVTRSATPPSASISQSTPTVGRVTGGRRSSMGDCPKRTSDLSADEEIAKWSKNPVYASDGESDGRRTDRSEMSLPWLDISVAKRELLQQSNVPSLHTTVNDLKKTVKKKGPTRIKAHQPPMDAVAEVPPRTARKPRVVVPPPAVAPPKEKEISATDLAVRKIIKDKLGKSFAEMSPSALKTLSEERMKELKERYASNRPKVNVADRQSPATLQKRSHSRGREPSERVCPRPDPQIGRIAAV